MDPLGKGGFGVVQKAYHKKEQTYMAIKSFNITNDLKIYQIQFEDKIWKKIQEIQDEKGEKYFLKYYGMFRKEKNKDDFLLLQMQNGEFSLEEILSSGKVYKCKEILYVMHKLVKQLSILEENGISNHDIKPSNIVLVEEQSSNNGEDDGYSYHITDFGIACEVPLGEKLMCGKEMKGLSKKYAAPEILKIYKENKNYNNFIQYDPFEGDVYSLGIVLLQMIDYEWINQFSKIEFNSFYSLHKNKLNEYKELLPLLEEMLKINPDERINF